VAELPTDVEEREQMRSDIRKRLVRAAEVQARTLGRSIECRWGTLPGWSAGKHIDDPDGCRDDSTTCLCSCHDFQPTATTEGADRG